ncbi:GABA-gated chloride channel 2 subunit-like protein, partial [Dinothrombium tinctorium]
MFIISISTVSEVKMVRIRLRLKDFTSDFYFRQTWIDPRLSFVKLPEISNLFVGAEVAKKIWVPDTFFANEKQAYFHDATTANRFLRISSEGEVFQSIRSEKTYNSELRLQARDSLSH